MIPSSSSKPVINEKNLAGVYVLVGLTMKTGKGPEKNLSGLFKNTSSDKRFIQLNQDNTIYYIKQRRLASRRVQDKGTWNLFEGNNICIDGDEGVIKKFDGRLLIIASRDQNDFETTITVTYAREAELI